MRNNIAKAITILISALLVTSCTSIHKKAPIEIPEQIRNGNCELPVQELTGTTSRDIVNFSVALIDQISFCKLEKGMLIKLIEQYNKGFK